MEFLEFYEIDVEKAKTPDGEMPLETILDEINDFVRSGKIEFKKDDDDINVVFNREKQSAIVFNTKYLTKVVYNDKKDADFEQRIKTTMDCLSGMPPGTMQQLSAKDYSKIKVLALIFLAI